MPRTVPVSSTQVPGNFVTSALWNAGPAASNTFLVGVPLCQVSASTTQNMTSGVNTAINFDTTQLDTDGGHSNVTNNTRYTCQVAGWYLAIGTVCFAANTNGSRGTQVAKNGVGITAGQVSTWNAGPTFFSQVTSTALVQLAVGDFVETFGFQSSTVILSTFAGNQNSMQVIWLKS